MHSFNFIRGSSRKRHDIAETALGNTYEALNSASAEAKLGLAHAAALRSALDRMYIPDIRHGHIMLDTMPSFGIPLIVAHRKDRLTLDPAYRIPNDIQNEAARKKGIDTKTIDLVRERIRQEPKNGLLDVSQLPSAGVTTIPQAIRYPSHFNRHREIGAYFVGTPIVVLNTAESNVTAPEVLGHESEHCIQLEEEPITDQHRIPAANLSRELGGYYTGDALIGDHADRGDIPLTRVSYNSQTIEGLRRRHNTPDNPWRSSEDLARDIAAAGLHIITPELSEIWKINTPEAWSEFQESP